MREKFQRFGKGDMRVFLDEGEDIAAFAAGPAFETLPARIDREGGIGVIMEWAEGFEERPGRAKGEVAADDIDDIVGFSYAFSQRGPIVDHGATLIA